MSKKKTTVRDVELNVMSNTPTEDHYAALKQFYLSFAQNQIALMQAKIKDDPEGKCDLLLIHQEFNPVTKKVLSIPVAKIFLSGEAEQYVAPDGRGDWLERPKTNVAAEPS